MGHPFETCYRFFWAFTTLWSNLTSLFGFRLFEAGNHRPASRFLKLMCPKSGHQMCHFVPLCATFAQKIQNPRTRRGQKGYQNGVRPGPAGSRKPPDGPFCPFSKFSNPTTFQKTIAQFVEEEWDFGRSSTFLKSQKNWTTIWSSELSNSRKQTD